MTLYEVDLLSARYRRVQAREDRRAALGAWLLANVNRDSKSRPQPFELEEVVSWLGHGFQESLPPPPPPEPATPEELRERLSLYSQMFSSSNGQG